MDAQKKETKNNNHNDNDNKNNNNIMIIIIIIIAVKSVNFISLHVFNICKFLTSGIVVVPQILIGYLS